MKLVSLYCSDPQLFPDIHFEDGFNVVYAEVTDPHADDRDSHNLGKTFLITVIDFALLGTVDKNHDFRKHGYLFESLTFYLEFLTPSGVFVTIRRGVTGNQNIAIQESEEINYDLRRHSLNEWTHSKLGLKRARGIADELLSLDVIHPYAFRKGLGYILRRQNDYDEVFRITKFASGNDIDWKPFMALLLGLDHDLVKEKYQLDNLIKKQKEHIKRVREEAPDSSQQYGAVQGRIDILQDSIARTRSQVNTFSFREVEETVSQETVDRIESQTAYLNERVYTLRYELGQVRRGLESEVSFDLDEVRVLFEEAGIAFGGSIEKSYEDLIDFNQRLAAGRKRQLRELEASLKKQIRTANQKLELLDKQRQQALALLTEQKTFRKHQQLQERILDQEKELVRLTAQLEALDHVATLERHKRQLEARRLELVEMIESMMREQPQRYRSIRQIFASIALEILDAPALLHVEVNTNGNLAFGTTTLESTATRRETSEGKGTSYLKMLCVCLDLAIAIEYADDSFYHFIYHDGVFEGLDDRRKVKLLSLIRQICDEQHLQYILTIIDSDIPRNPDGDQLLFAEDEIIRRLHDQGDEGRLFRAPPF